MQSPLVLHHEKMGATLDRGAVPLQYRDPVEEYWTVRKQAGLADVSHLGRLTITGKDRVSFLNGLLTNDVTKLKEGGGIQSALLNTKARVLADLYLYGQEDSVTVDTGDSPGEKVKSILDQFIITEDVKIEDSTGRLLMLTVQGPKAAEIVEEVLQVDAHGLEQLHFASQGPAIIVSRDRTGVGGFDIIVPKDEAESVWQTLLLKGAGLGLEPVGVRALEIFRLEKGVPRYGVDVDENTIVLEAGFKEAISFSKGCYLGQEVVARATHIGRVNRRLVQLHVDAKAGPAHGSKLKADGKDAGIVTSSCFSPGLAKVVALGYVHRDWAVTGQSVGVEAPSGELPGVVTKIL